ncbi:hypothetical protein L1987_86945 [Smallanthus sonchifolius]|uniref:Uncharacterized protein n=1 Tax=Smallanthus sonchifolius TaxID=185202 RepID=A0ACB8Y1Y7_9ASTR|nr:hypothetical protein L1987_86945 [Smallanthus sonchifolius]
MKTCRKTHKTIVQNQTTCALACDNDRKATKAASCSASFKCWTSCNAYCIRLISSFDYIVSLLAFFPKKLGFLPILCTACLDRRCSFLDRLSFQRKASSELLRKGRVR